MQSHVRGVWGTHLSYIILYDMLSYWITCIVSKLLHVRGVWGTHLSYNILYYII